MDVNHLFEKLDKTIIDMGELNEDFSFYNVLSNVLESEHEDAEKNAVHYMYLPKSDIFAVYLPNVIPVKQVDVSQYTTEEATAMLMGAIYRAVVKSLDCYLPTEKSEELEKDYKQLVKAIQVFVRNNMDKMNYIQVY